MQTIELQRRWGLMESDVERIREAISGTFGYRQSRIVRDFRRKVIGVEPISPWEFIHNIVTNQGINSFLSVYLDAATQITSWNVVVFKTNTTPLATHTYASPGYTEVDTADVDEAIRQVWTGGSASGQSIDNSASPAVYTGDAAFTAYGSALVGGGSAPTTLADTAGGGTLYSSGLYSSSKAMDVDVQLEITYTFTGADDGV